MSETRDPIPTPGGSDAPIPFLPPSAADEPRGLAAALAEFTRRLAGFGLSATQDPLLANQPAQSKARRRR